eukprot:549934-Rhodomonas_salina.1
MLLGCSDTAGMVNGVPLLRTLALKDNQVRFLELRGFEGLKSLTWGRGEQGKGQRCSVPASTGRPRRPIRGPSEQCLACYAHVYGKVSV